MPQPAALARTDEPSIHDVTATPTQRAPANLFSLMRAKSWWSRSGSNRRPEACKATALPTELRPQERVIANSFASIRRKPSEASEKRRVVGPDRFELSTPRLSSVCSNQLSYGPSPAGAAYVIDAGAATGLAYSEPLPGVKERRETKTAATPHNALEAEVPKNPSKGACPSRPRGSALAR